MTWLPSLIYAAGGITWIFMCACLLRLVLSRATRQLLARLIGNPWT